MIIEGNRIVKETTHVHECDERASDKNYELKSLEDQDIDSWLLINQIDAPRRKRIKNELKTELEGEAMTFEVMGGDGLGGL